MWLTKLLRPKDYEQMTLSVLAAHSGLSVYALRLAAWDGRLEAKKSGGIWLSTPAAVERAVQAGRLRRKR